MSYFYMPKEEYISKMSKEKLKAIRGEDAVHRIEMLPFAQSEIIRCKDCKYWIPYDWMFSEVWQSENMADYSENEIGCNYFDMAMKANDFCSRAVRRTE